MCCYKPIWRVCFNDVSLILNCRCGILLVNLFTKIIYDRKYNKMDRSCNFFIFIKVQILTIKIF